MSEAESNIRKFLSGSSSFQQHELDAFISRRQALTFSKGDFLVRGGQTCRHLYFLHSGVLSLLILKDGEEHVNDFSLSGKFITCYTSFMTSTPSQVYLRAEQDCILSAWGSHYIKGLIRENASWTEHKSV